MREAERAAPCRGRLRHGHHGPQLNVEREHALIREPAVGFGAEQKVIAAKGAIEQLPGLPGRIGIFLLARQLEQPARGGENVNIVFGRHPGELDLLRIVAVKAAAEAAATRGRADRPIDQTPGAGQVFSFLCRLMQR